MAGIAVWRTRAEKFGAVVLRRFKMAYAQKSSGGEDALIVESRLELGPKKSLLLVRCGSRKFLVASGAESISAMVEVRRRARPLTAIPVLGSVR